MSTLEQRAEAFLALADAAIDGKWQVGENTDDWERQFPNPFKRGTDDVDLANARLWVAARNDAPTLIRDLLAESKRLAVEHDAALAREGALRSLLNDREAIGRILAVLAHIEVRGSPGL